MGPVKRTLSSRLTGNLFSSRWRAPADRKRLTHVPDEDSGADGLDAELLEGDEDSPEGGGDAPHGAMPTGTVVLGYCGAQVMWVDVHRTVQGSCGPFAGRG